MSAPPFHRNMPPARVGGLVTCGIYAAAFLLPAGSAAGAEKPNVVFILSDDVGTGDVGDSGGRSRITTPNINRLAAGGMRFSQAYAPGAVCSPSRYALLTGAYPCRGPLRSTSANWRTPLTIDPDGLSLPRFFERQGYRTAHIGKWHLGYGDSTVRNWAGEIKPGPLEIGFDYHLGLPTNHNDGFKTYVENHRLRWLKDDVSQLGGRPEVDQLTRLRYDDEVDSTLTARAIEFMKEDSDRPFFVYLALVATHTHITPHESFRGTSGIGQLGDYINELDHHVGEIMATLEAEGLADDTIVFFSSDNGGHFKDHFSAGKDLNLRSRSGDVARKSRTAKIDAYEQFGHRTNGDLRGHKGTNFEGGFRVPFIVRWPGRVPAGTRSDQIITLADTLATTAGLLGQTLPASAGVDSYDLSGVMLGEAAGRPVRTTAVLQTGSGVLAFRQGDWKLRFTKPPTWSGGSATLPEGACELYHLAADPDESEDLADEQPQRVAEMRAHLLTILNEGSGRS